jgi:hypothetical protein
MGALKLDIARALLGAGDVVKVDGSLVGRTRRAAVYAGIER